MLVTAQPQHVFYIFMNTRILYKICMETESPMEHNIENQNILYAILGIKSQSQGVIYNINPLKS